VSQVRRGANQIGGSHLTLCLAQDIKDMKDAIDYLNSIKRTSMVRSKWPSGHHISLMPN
jgi:hypothetical protein